MTVVGTTSEQPAEPSVAGDIGLAFGEGWECAALPSGAATDPTELVKVAADWLPAEVPGTAAGALRTAGRPARPGELDEQDWWFRCRLDGRPDGTAGPRLLELGGVATVADVWWNGVPVLHSENMYRAHRVGVEVDAGENELVIRCAALIPQMAGRRPRPRWKTYMVEHQNLRWFRTSLLGRIPGWAVVPPIVGPWRPVRLLGPGDVVPTTVALAATCDGDGGVVTVSFDVVADAAVAGVALADATLRITRLGAAAELGAGSAAESSASPAGTGGDPVTTALATVDLTVGEHDGRLRLEGSVQLAAVDRWWPHTHGPQPLYEVWADIDGRAHRLGEVGFRTIAVDRRDGDFRVAVNGVEVFCRGACWMPVDPVAVASPATVVEDRLGLVRAANMNMLRVPGTTVYEDRHFLEQCDRLGIMVWHDCMFAFLDPPQDDAFVDDAAAEVTEAAEAMAGHPSVVIVCGNQEVEEIAAMNGQGGDRSSTPFFDETVPAIIGAVLPEVAYVTSNPTGGTLPFRMDSGVSQYFGVGGYLRPVEDARRSQVRFAAECLAFATPPEPVTVDELCGGAYRANHEPSWKQGVHHDAGRSWDMEDVRSFYMASLFGVDPLKERYVDAERALELGRATNAQLMGAVLTEWRHPGSACGGGLVLSFADLAAGAGWGLVDVAGRPKAPWYVLRRAFQPVALLAVDEGLNGLALHIVNDTAAPVRGRLVVELVARGELYVERGEVAVDVAPRGSQTVDAETVVGGYRDVSYAYRFSPPAQDAVVATLFDDDGTQIAQAVHLPLGQGRPLENDIGLRAVARSAGDGRWVVDVHADRLAQWVTVRADGFVADDSWFHLPPGADRQVYLRPENAGHRDGTGSSPPRGGTVQALNAVARATIKVEKAPDAEVERG